MLRKIISSILVIVFLTMFAGCGCQHSWSVATCSTPKTCYRCGAVEGFPIEHKFEDADCENPKKCSLCNKTEGDPLDHNYSNGKCIYCDQKDPDFIDLENIGFLNLSDVGALFLINAYDLSDNKVCYITTSSTPFLVFRIFYERYFKEGMISYDKLDKESPSITELFNTPTTYVYNVVSNDVATYYNNGPEQITETIEERVVTYSNQRLILKTINRGWSSPEEQWYVPVDMLDFSTLEITPYEDKNGYYMCSVNFK